MKLVEILLYPFKEEKFLLKVSYILIILIIPQSILGISKFSADTIKMVNTLSNLLILGYMYIFANNIINNVVPATPNFLKDFLRILKHGFIGTWVINIYIVIFAVITCPITLFLASKNMIQVMYLILILIGILITPIAFCMYAYKLSSKESLKINNIKTAIKTMWNIKFLYLKSIFIAISIIILSFGIGMILNVFFPFPELLAVTLWVLIGLICTSIFAHLFKNNILSKSESN